MKAIIEVARKGAIFRAAAQQLADARQGRTPDFRPTFESARSLFADGGISVPFESVEILVPLAQVA